MPGETQLSSVKTLDLITLSAPKETIRSELLVSIKPTLGWQIFFKNLFSVRISMTSDLWGCAICALCSHTSLQRGCRESWHSPRSHDSQSSHQNGAAAGNRRPDMTYQKRRHLSELILQPKHSVNT